MTMQNAVRILKAGIQYFTSTTGAIFFVITLIGLAVVVPPLITIPIVIGLGVGIAAIGAWRKNKEIKEEEAALVLKNEEHSEEIKGKGELLDINREMNHAMVRIAEAEAKIADSESKIEAKLTEHLELGHEILKRASPAVHNRHIGPETLKRTSPAIHHRHVSAELLKRTSPAINNRQVDSHHHHTSSSTYLDIQPGGQRGGNVTIKISNMPSFFARNNENSPSNLSPSTSTPEDISVYAPEEVAEIENLHQRKRRVA
jgi:hypothetical protein